VARKNGKQVTDAPNIFLERAVPFTRHLLDLSRMDWFDAKPDRRSDGKQDKNRQNKQLCEFEWRLGLCRSKRMERRNFSNDCTTQTKTLK
jgi:hypothetical protein